MRTGRRRSWTLQPSAPRQCAGGESSRTWMSIGGGERRGGCGRRRDARGGGVALLFKNETHNHPTEIEPYGGASTCLGGAIRDPMSGRGTVFQALRVSGSGDPRQERRGDASGQASATPSLPSSPPAASPPTATSSALPRAWSASTTTRATWQSVWRRAPSSARCRDGSCAGSAPPLVTWSCS